jgi:hypothetical protein
MPGMGGASRPVSWALIGPHGPRCPASQNRTPRPLEGLRPATMEGHGPLATARELRPMARELRPLSYGPWPVSYGPWPVKFFMARGPWPVRYGPCPVRFFFLWPMTRTNLSAHCQCLSHSYENILSLPLYPKRFTVRLKVERMDWFCSIGNEGEWQNKKYETSRVTHLWSQEDNFLI